MSDDISIPRAPLQARSFTHSYNARRPARTGGTSVLLMAAVGAGVLLVGATAVWSLRGHHPAEIPVVEADPRPIRVKPADPGGMQVVGANVEMGDTGGDGTMAPPPEAPAPLALRAQMQPQASPPTPVPAALTVADPAPAPAAPVVPAPVAPAPVAAAEPAPAPAAPAQAVGQSAPPSPTPSSTMMVQLAALTSEQAAQAEWQRLAKRAPELLGGRQPVVLRAEKNGRPIWRLRTGGFTDLPDATSFCDKLRAKGGTCTLASF